jgi:methylated-DNA-[protein]-cysteine S-methyltransferase
MSLSIATIDTPLGPFTLGLRGETLCAAAFSDRWALAAEPAPARVAACFAAYWAGDLGALDAIAVDPGGTPFQARVWAALRRIPAGNTVSYAELAATIGAPRASRAVGAANGANPVWIVIPCHRVIGADGSLRGYAGGVDRKLQLLAHEGVSPLPPCRSPTPRAPSPAAGSWPAAGPRSPSAEPPSPPSSWPRPAPAPRSAALPGSWAPSA